MFRSIVASVCLQCSTLVGVEHTVFVDVIFLKPNGLSFDLWICGDVGGGESRGKHGYTDKAEAGGHDHGSHALLWGSGVDEDENT